ncbi:ATP-binding protein [Kitasatospora herbaricolor]|uniref:ATP-binding protein n=1 Tax=Kitasatospora herbaricolor TaxID=68217 RepID=UPI0036D823B3
MDQLAPQNVALIRNSAVAHCRDIRLAQNRPADDNALDGVALVVTELVTNALKHATTPGAPTLMGILLALHRDDVLVVVSDPSTQGPLLDTTAPGLEVGAWGWDLYAPSPATAGAGTPCPSAKPSGPSARSPPHPPA